MIIEMSIWDNTTTVEEKQDILLFCEHAMNKAAYNHYAIVKVIHRDWASFTAKIKFFHPEDSVIFSIEYKKRLARLSYFWKDEEPLQLNWLER